MIVGCSRQNLKNLARCQITEPLGDSVEHALLLGAASLPIWGSYVAGLGKLIRLAPTVFPCPHNILSDVLDR
jgi:hypothetical protein